MSYDDFLESEEFYNAMQAYRHAPLDGQERVIECFEKVKSMVRAELAQQAVVIEQMREAMLEHGKPHLHNEIEWDEALKAELIEEKAAHFKTHNWLIDRNEELAAAQKDAERYRWLRNDPPLELAVRKFPGETEKGCYFDGENLDAAIDEAIAKEQP